MAIVRIKISDIDCVLDDIERTMTLTQEQGKIVIKFQIWALFSKILRPFLRKNTTRRKKVCV
jgi:hypothetical protein